MAGKPSITNELIEELMEGKSMLNSFSKEVGEIINSLNKNEELDHQNDKIRTEAFGFLLDSLEAYNAKDYEGMQKFLHAALQKFHEQEKLDFQDDKPRADVRIALSEIRLKTIYCEENITKLTGKLGRTK